MKFSLLKNLCTWCCYIFVGLEDWKVQRNNQIWNCKQTLLFITLHFLLSLHWFWIGYPYYWIKREWYCFDQVEPRPGVLRLMDEAKAAVSYSTYLSIEIDNQFMILSFQSIQMNSIQSFVCDAIFFLQSAGENASCLLCSN